MFVAFISNDELLLRELRVFRKEGESDERSGSPICGRFAFPSYGLRHFLTWIIYFYFCFFIPHTLNVSFIPPCPSSPFSFSSFLLRLSNNLNLLRPPYTNANDWMDLQQSLCSEMGEELRFALRCQGSRQRPTLRRSCLRCTPPSHTYVPTNHDVPPLHGVRNIFFPGKESWNLVKNREHWKQPKLRTGRRVGSFVDTPSPLNLSLMIAFFFHFTFSNPFHVVLYSFFSRISCFSIFRKTVSCQWSNCAKHLSFRVTTWTTK